MAGIGFKLQKVLSEKSYLNTIRGYFYAALISSGPWMLSVICVGVLAVIAQKNIDTDGALLFRSIIVYSYAFSLIVTGVIQLVTTRYLSDKLYAEDERAVLPTFSSAQLLTTILSLIVSVPFYAKSTLPMDIKILSIILYLIVSNIWIVMVFLSALRSYLYIVISFLAGVIVSIVLGYYMGDVFGIKGMLGGFTIGQGVILLLLSARIYYEFEYTANLNKEFFYYFRQYPQLIFIGLFYNLAIWGDKFVFWFSNAGEVVADTFYICTTYDTVAFLAYITIIPSMSLFLIRIETSFYSAYKDFYGAIINRRPYSVITEKKKVMVNSIVLSIRRLFVLQGTITIIAMIFAPIIIDTLHLDWKQLHIFRILILGSFVHSLIMILNIMIQYFDSRNTSLLLVSIFCATNIIFSYISLSFGFQAFGYGYFIAATISLIIGYILFVRLIDKLEYLTFMQQPLHTTTPEYEE